MLDDVRRICLSFDGSTERLSHGSPAFFTNKGKGFCSYHDDHHGDGIVGLWIAAPDGAQAQLIAENPEIFYRPAYVGSRGWVGVRLDRDLDLGRLEQPLEDAHATVEPKPRPKPS